MTGNREVLTDFVRYCEENPNLRFWQALRNWAEVNFLVVSDSPNVLYDGQDTFYWEGKNS